MMPAAVQAAAESLSTPPDQGRVAERYGDAGKAGWTPLPDVLIFNQSRLKLGSEDLNVLLNMMAHYYTAGEMPFVRPTVIAKRMGVSARTVQRSIARLRKLRLLDKTQLGKGRFTHDLTPLIEKLQPLARERIADRTMRKAHENGVTQLDRDSGVSGPSSGLEPSRKDAGSTPVAVPNSRIRDALMNPTLTNAKSGGN